MMAQSPKFKIEKMAPLSQHQKILIEEEPIEDLIEVDETKISFNEKLIVCDYKPWQTVIQIRKTIEKLKGYQNVHWINPILDVRIKNPSRSILKNPSKLSSNLAIKE
ncbi:unnamed protein product [Paramecium pentaurelia]|uniref:Uncharacterized protein n=1 Tax=Paramecium pentaurelia TaxID=43138 RepID=A0A8S1SNH4_9CILI|nr:unnamed protein product [Paramecium pentaurelia]